MVIYESTKYKKTENADHHYDHHQQQQPATKFLAVEHDRPQPTTITTTTIISLSTFFERNVPLYKLLLMVISKALTFDTEMFSIATKLANFPLDPLTTNVNTAGLLWNNLFHM